MLMLQSNGGNIAKTISGRGLAHRQLSKRQAACLAATLLEEHTAIEPTAKMLAAELKVSPGYIRLARRMSPGKRAATLAGKDNTPFSVFMQATRYALPKPCISDSELAAVIAAVGIDHLLNVAAAVERNGHA